MTTKITEAESDAKTLEAAHLLCDIDYPGEKVSDDFALRAYALKNENAKANPRVLLDACDGGGEDQFKLLLCSAGTHNYVLMENDNGKLSSITFDCKSHEVKPDSSDSRTLLALFHRIFDYVMNADDIGPADITIAKLTDDPEDYGLSKIYRGKQYPRTLAGIKKFVSDMVRLVSEYGIEITFDDCAGLDYLTTADIADDDIAEDTVLCYVWANLLSTVDFRNFDPNKLEESLK